jgi:hypothetical protein
MLVLREHVGPLFYVPGPIKHENRCLVLFVYGDKGSEATNCRDLKENQMPVITNALKNDALPLTTSISRQTGYFKARCHPCNSLGL